MAGRPLKQGLDYFSLDVDFFQSAKVKRIIKAQGFQSTSVLICLLSNIYRKNGYYLKWDEDMPFLIADELGVGAGERMVTEVLSKALSVDFFDAGIFEEYGALTSEGVQERFFTAALRRQKLEIIKEFFLLDPSESFLKNAVWKSATTMPFFKKKCKFGIIVNNNSISADRNSINVGNNSPSTPSTPSTTVPQAVIDVYKTEICPVCSKVELEKLGDDVTRYGEIAVVKAIERAAIRNKRSIGYIEGILKKWEINGYDEEDSQSKTKENPQLAIAKQAMELLRGD